MTGVESIVFDGLVGNLDDPAHISHVSEQTVDSVLQTRDMGQV